MKLLNLILSSTTLLSLGLAADVTHDDEYNAVCPLFNNKERYVLGNKITYRCDKYPEGWSDNRRLDDVTSPDHCISLCTMSDSCVGAQFWKGYCYWMNSEPASLGPHPGAVYMERTDTLKKCKAGLSTADCPTESTTPSPITPTTKDCPGQGVEIPAVGKKFESKCQTLYDTKKPYNRLYDLKLDTLQQCLDSCAAVNACTATHYKPTESSCHLLSQVSPFVGHMANLNWDMYLLKA